MIYAALSEAGALNAMSGVDIVLLIGVSDNLLMKPEERAAAMLPLCQAALYTGGSDRTSFLHQVARLLASAFPSIDPYKWRDSDLEEAAANLRDRVGSIASHSPDAWLTFHKCLGTAYRASWS